MLISLLVFFTFLSSSHFIAKKWDGLGNGSWILVLFTEILTAVTFLGIVDLLDKIYLLLVGFFFLVVSYFWRRGLKVVDDVHATKSNFLGFIGIFGLALVFLNTLTPLNETDSIGYHLPIVSQMLSTGNVWEVFQAGFVGPNTYFPANHEAIQVFLALLTGNYELTFLVTVFAFALCVQALGRIQKRRGLSALLMVSIMSTPFLFMQFLNFQVDLFLFFLFNAALLFLMSAIQKKEHTDLLKFFLIFGLALGTKYNSLLQLVALVPFLFLVIYKFKKDWRKIWWFPLLSFATGAFWFIRNWIVTGNPLYPFGLDLGILHFEGHKRFLQDMDGTSILSAIHSFGVKPVFLEIASNPSFVELGFASLILPVLGFLAGFTLFYFGSREKKFMPVLFVLLLTFVVELFLYFNAPYTFTLWNETVRYSTVWFSMSFVLLVSLLGRSKFFDFFVGLLALSVGVYNFLFSGILSTQALRTLLIDKLTDGSAVSLFLPLLSVVLLLLGIWLLPRLKKTALTFSCLFFIAVLVTLNTSPEVQSQEADDVYLSQTLVGYENLLGSLHELRGQNFEKGNTIAVAGTTFYYLFEKEGLNPIYVNVDGCAERTYPDYRSLDLSVRSAPNSEAWKALLRTLNARYLLVGFNNAHSANNTLFEKEWADADPSMFTPLYDLNGLSLYQIN